jgi:hypothetical protein
LFAKPDFLFLSEAAYQDAAFPDAQLRMLAVKTTCCDRWRQVLNQADRVKVKHLLTLQEGASEGQFAEMTGAGMQLVIPAKLIDLFPKPIRRICRRLRASLAMCGCWRFKKENVYGSS